MTNSITTTIFVAVGNPFRSNDAVGIAVLRHLRKDIPPGVTVLEETGDGAERFEVWKGAGAVILVDAAQSGSPPGPIHRPPLPSIPEPFRAGICRGVLFVGAQHYLP